jgi:hypothetical protein
MNLFLILSRSSNFYTNALSSFLRKKGMDVVQIVDTARLDEIENYCVNISDEEIISKSFMSLTRSLEKTPNAWDKSIYYIKDLRQYDYFYIIEDDVYCKDFSIFANVIKEMELRNEDFISKGIETEQENPLWNHWEIMHNLPVKYNVNVKSFNPFCRISKNLLSKIIQFYNENNYLYFHESMFATICVNSGLSFLDYIKCDKLNKFFGYFDYRKYNSLKFDSDKIVHPIKCCYGISNKNYC